MLPLGVLVLELGIAPETHGLSLPLLTHWWLSVLLGLSPLLPCPSFPFVPMAPHFLPCSHLPLSPLGPRAGKAHPTLWSSPLSQLRHTSVCTLPPTRKVEKTRMMRGAAKRKLRHAPLGKTEGRHEEGEILCPHSHLGPVWSETQP